MTLSSSSGAEPRTPPQTASQVFECRDCPLREALVAARLHFCVAKQLKVNVSVFTLEVTGVKGQAGGDV